ncbi:MAG: hypothetical protein IPI13_00440 [Actinomycetales bacterium]|uniref:VOC domain-containing protein n=1 Tax=Candidatus Phosphoribacter hodrii TaxID=2953743 RepID=A0A935M2A4_9MICO|nr:hypothetical protein [Candidatus Phosphoribacter hodrii]
MPRTSPAGCWPGCARSTRGWRPTDGWGWDARGRAVGRGARRVAVGRSGVGRLGSRRRGSRRRAAGDSAACRGGPGARAIHPGGAGGDLWRSGAIGRRGRATTGGAGDEPVRLGRPWWRSAARSGLPPAGHEERALVHYRAEGTPLVGGLPDGAGMPPADYRVDLRRARWSPESASALAAARAHRADGGVGGVGEAGGVGRVRADGLAVGVNGVGADGEADVGGGRTAYRRGGLHHVEVWVGDLVAARASWGWLLGELGWVFGDDWGHGAAWELGPVYLVMESGPDVAAGGHDRRRPGVSHWPSTRDPGPGRCHRRAAEGHGWELLFADPAAPHAGGPDHSAAYLQDGQGSRRWVGRHLRSSVPAKMTVRAPYPPGRHRVLGPQRDRAGALFPSDRGSDPQR